MTGVSARAAAVTAQVTAGFDGLPALEREWRALFERTTCEPAMSFEWTQALVRTQVRPDDAGFIVQLRREGRLAGVVPLIARAVRVFRLPRLRHVVLRPLAELKNTHSDLLLEAHDPELVEALIGAVRSLDRRWDSLRLSKLVVGHPLTPALEAASVKLGLTPRRRFRKAAYWLGLPLSFDEYLASRSSKFRNYARRAEKKLRAAGRLEEREITTPADFDKGYEAVLAIEQASWKQPHGTSLASVPAQAALYRTWGLEGAAAGQVHLQLLTLDGEPIAYNLGCTYRGTYYYLKTSYAARYRPLSPATFLRLSLIRRLIARGCSEVDFCGTPYEWEQQWTDTYRWHQVLSIYADTWRGRMFSLLDKWSHYSSDGQAIEHEDPRSERPGG